MKIGAHSQQHPFDRNELIHTETTSEREVADNQPDTKRRPWVLIVGASFLGILLVVGVVANVVVSHVDKVVLDEDAATAANAITDFCKKTLAPGLEIPDADSTCGCIAARTEARFRGDVYFRVRMQSQSGPTDEDLSEMLIMCGFTPKPTEAAVASKLAEERRSADVPHGPVSAREADPIAVPGRVQRDPGTDATTPEQDPISAPAPTNDAVMVLDQRRVTLNTQLVAAAQEMGQGSNPDAQRAAAERSLVIAAEIRQVVNALMPFVTDQRRAEYTLSLAQLDQATSAVRSALAAPRGGPMSDDAVEEILERDPRVHCARQCMAPRDGCWRQYGRDSDACEPLAASSLACMLESCR